MWGSRPFPKDERAGKFVTLASGIAGDDALPIRAKARVVGATMKAGETATYNIGPARKAYLVPATGKVDVEGNLVNARDGAAIMGLETVSLTALEDSEIVLVDVES